MTERERATHAYAGYCHRCGTLNAASVIYVGGERDNAKFVAAIIRRGDRVETVTIEQVRATLNFCACKRAKKSKQRDLFAEVSP